MNEQTKATIANQIELHYYFSDNSHSLDAFIRNKCETEFLHVIKEILHILDLDIKIETIAFEKGGLKEKWEFINNNSGGILAVTAIATLIVTLVLNQYPSSNPELDNLRKKDLELNIEKHKLEIKKLKDEEKIDDTKIHEIVSYFNSDYKVIKHRSTFFETLMLVDKITKIETNRMYKNKLIETINIVEKNDFKNYVVSENKLPLEINENALIEIISPVLKQEGNYKWKGIYKGEPIEFYMKCKSFKQSIFNKEILFQNGFSILCVLEIKNAINELGEIRVKQYAVSTVLTVYQDNDKLETEQGKKYFAKKKEDASRPTLFD